MTLARSSTHTHPADSRFLAFTISIASIWNTLAIMSHHVINLPLLVKPELRYHFLQKPSLNHWVDGHPCPFALIGGLSTILMVSVQIYSKILEDVFFIS